MKGKENETRWQWVKRHKYQVLSLVLLVIVCFMAGTVASEYFTFQNEPTSEVVPTPTPAPTVHPTQTPQWTLPPWGQTPQPTPTVCCGQNASPSVTLAPWVPPWYATPTPTPTYQPPPTNAKNGSVCDINCDGYASGADFTKMMLYVLRAYTPTAIGLANIDINFDGIINFQDLNWCFRYIY